MLDAPLFGMLSLKTILVPVDFGESSGEALRYALALARAFDAHVVLMHAIDMPFYAYPSYPLLPMGDAAAAMERAALTGLDAELTRATQSWTKVTSMLRRGTPWREIIEVAEQKQVDLIVMGTHGHHGLSHALLGSVAERVIRASSVPVLTIRAASTGAPARAAKSAKGAKEDDDVDTYEERLSRPNAATIETATLVGAVTGLATGALAGPIGALAGGWLGSAVGTVTGVALDEQQSRERKVAAKLDEDMGVIGGDIGAADPNLPPARIGAFSAGSAGVGRPHEAGPSEGPMQDLSDDR